MAIPMCLRKSTLGSLGLWLGWLASQGNAQEGSSPGTATDLRGTAFEMFSNPMTLLLLSALVFYLLLIVPSFRANKKTQRELETMLANLKKNDRVVTTFGVHGVVAGIQNDAKTVTLRIDENSNAKMTVNREAIRVIHKD
jgi:preprotein translocase YajC subunit